MNELKICVSVFGWTIHGPESTHQNQMFTSVPHSLSTLYSRCKVCVIYIVLIFTSSVVPASAC